MSKRVSSVRDYFDCQNRSDVDAVVRLFADDCEVYNAAFPVIRGHNGVKGFCEGLYSRTSSRTFRPLTILEGPEVVMIEWQAHMQFPAGVVIGPHKLAEGFNVEIRGVNKFEFKPNSELISCLRVFHETSTVARLAAEHAQKS